MLQEVRKINYVLIELKKISKTLNRLDTNECNYGELSKSQKTRMANLEKKACDLAAKIDLYIYRQTDPRGCSLYLVDHETLLRQQYTNGMGL